MNLNLNSNAFSYPFFWASVKQGKANMFSNLSTTMIQEQLWKQREEAYRNVDVMLCVCSQLTLWLEASPHSTQQTDLNTTG